MMSLFFWLMMQSTAMAVFPIARSPMINSRCPRPRANIEIDDQQTRIDRLVDEIAVDDPRRGALDGLVILALDRLPTVEGAAERIDDAAKQGRSHRDAHDLAGAADLMPGLDGVDIVEQHATEQIAVEGESEADLTVFEVHELVEADIAQTGDARDAVGNGLDPAHLMGNRREVDGAHALFCLPQPGVKICRIAHGSIPRGFDRGPRASYCGG